MTDVCQVVITAPSAEWLAAFVQGLVDDRLCAGAHIVSEIRSIYRWDGEVIDRGEAHVSLHTAADRVDEIIRRTEIEHPYAVPCVVATPITDGNPAYLQWIVNETR